MPQTFTVEILEKITEEGTEEKLQEVAQLDREINRIKKKKKAAVKIWNEEMRNLEFDRDELLDVCEKGVGRVKVDVYTKIDEQRNEVNVFRCDNDEQIKQLTRPLTVDERQMDFTQLKDLAPGKDPGIVELESEEGANEDTLNDFLDEDEDDEPEEEPEPEEAEA